MDKKYILKGKEVVECGLIEWATWRKKADRKVAKDTVGDSEISTVFSGVDHQFGVGPPVLFETLVFSGSLDRKVVRYSTWEEAEAGHRAMVERVKSQMEQGESDG